MNIINYAVCVVLSCIVLLKESYNKLSMLTS